MDRIITMEQGGKLKRRDFLKVGAAVGGVILLGSPGSIFAQASRKISIATGGMGGVYFPLGGAIANVISTYIPNLEAAAEVTAASVDNCKLVAAEKSDLGIVMGDVGFDAYKGSGKFKEPLPVRNLAVLYPNLMHVVTVEGKNINKVADMKGKTVSTGAPGSGTEIKALRILEANGIDPDKDIKRDRLGASESAGALKDGKIDAYFWDGGVPTASVLDLAASPGVTIKILPHEDSIEKMTAKYGPVYYKSTIPKGVYSGVESDVAVAAVGNILICHEKMDDKLVHDILSAIFDHNSELVAVHKEAESIDVKASSTGSPIPYHKAAIQYYKEKGIEVQA